MYVISTSLVSRRVAKLGEEVSTYIRTRRRHVRREKKEDSLGRTNGCHGASEMRECTCPMSDAGALIGATDVSCMQTADGHRCTTEMPTDGGATSAAT